MSVKRSWILAALLGAITCVPAQAGVAIGIGVGVPVYRPYYRPWYPYRAAVVVAPVPVIVAPAPVVVAPAPVYYIQTAPGVYQPVNPQTLPPGTQLYQMPAAPVATAPAPATSYSPPPPAPIPITNAPPVQ
jgi:hypothetical protein